jgi:uncharacterized membrane protein YdjX (TVP38/TMEM64 family)
MAAARSRKRLWAVAAGLLALGVWGIWSYRRGGLLHVLLGALPAGGSRLEALRAYVAAWGALAPLVYVAAVTVEVLVAPIPGTLLYAPAGAIFGGLVGGTLSLAGNVLGAIIACWIAGTFGERWRSRPTALSALGRSRDLLLQRGAWIIFLLRVNPFTSSDLVSYAAGLAGVRPHQVGVGTLFGMAPLCYAQSYLAQSLFEWLSPAALLAIGVALVAAVAAVILWKRVR